MFSFLRSIRKSQSGASAAEYALIVAVLGTFVVAGTIAFGGSLQSALENNAKALDSSS